MQKSDEDLNVKHASTQVTNLFLVAGYMKALGVKQYKIGQSNNTFGLIVSPIYNLELGDM